MREPSSTPPIGNCLSTIFHGAAAAIGLLTREISRAGRDRVGARCASERPAAAPRLEGDRSAAKLVACSRDTDGLSHIGWEEWFDPRDGTYRTRDLLRDVVA